MKEVILVGRGPSWQDCPFDAETWGVLTCYCVPELRDKHFDKMFAFDPVDAEIAEGLKIAIERGVPIVGVHSYATEPYPTEEVLDKIYRKGYLQNSICHMIAMAILRGYEKIRLYGIDQYRGVYLLQKGAVEFWAGVAIGRGIIIEVAPTSMLFTEYLREVASFIGTDNDSHLTTIQDVLPFSPKGPIMAFPMKDIQHNADLPRLSHPDRKLTPMTLYAFYDLEVAPATYDILKFLILAERERVQLGCSDLRVVIVPASNGFRKGDLEFYQHFGSYDDGYMEWRLKNILIPCCWLEDSIKGVMTCGSREEAQKLIDGMDGYLYPKNYTIAAPTGIFADAYIQATTDQLPSLKASEQAKQYVSHWLKDNTNGGKVVTINLRETTYQPDRNSNVLAWRQFYWKLDQMGYVPLMLPDMEKLSTADGFHSYPEALWNMELRLALYELSYLNLFINTGPALLALLDKDVRCLVFKWMTPTSETTNEDFHLRNGLKVREQWKHLTPGQRMVWEDDRLEVIEREFKAMAEKLREEILV